MDIEASEWLQTTIGDPIVDLLLENSSLTPHQLESLLIDHLSALTPAAQLTYAARASLRTPPVSRGAFNRTIRQARRNIVASLYTLLLLAYLGILQAPHFEEYDALATKIREYNGLLRSTDQPTRDVSHAILTLRRELQAGIQRLSSPSILRP